MNGRIEALALAVALICGLSAGCVSSPSPTCYYFNVVHPGWDTVIYINGNPAARGGSAASIVYEMSLWMRKGSNPIRITTKRHDSISARDECDIRFVKVTDPMNPNSAETLGGIHHSPSDADQYEVEFEVTSERPIVWLWERADTLGGRLTDADRKSISNLIGRLADGLRKKDTDAVRKYVTMPWGSGPPPECMVSPKMSRKELEKRQRELLQKMFDYPDFTVTVSDPGEREFIVGTQAVMVCTKPAQDPSVKNYIIYAGHAPDYEEAVGEMASTISLEQLHFFKVDGKWIMLAN